MKIIHSHYENILRDIDTKSVAHQKLAIFYENLNEFELALHHYELSLKLEPKNEFFKEKIQELNSILEYQSLFNCHTDPCSLLPLEKLF